MKVLIGTTNPSKVKRFTDLLSNYNIEILTLKDLVDKTENEMMKIRNLGKKSLKEVMDKVKDMGLTFKDEN